MVPIPEQRRTDPVESLRLLRAQAEHLELLRDAARDRGSDDRAERLDGVIADYRSYIHTIESRIPLEPRGEDSHLHPSGSPRRS